MKSVTVVGQSVYCLVQRQSNIFIEKLDEALNLDSALTGSADTPTTQWSGLDHLNGQEVCVIADGIVLDNKITVTGGTITLDQPAQSIEVGLPYTHVIEPLPPGISQGYGGRKLRLIELMLRVHETQALRVDVGRGLKDTTLKAIGETPILNAPPPIVSEDIKIRALGWQQDGTDSLWRIEQDTPYPFTLLSAVSEIMVNE